jgi:F0F1-type ATP synthase membrane subunit c/vacuolar-type H+-ATPase subunit K
MLEGADRPRPDRRPCVPSRALAASALSAACMSLLSKKMPKSWAAGILNAGFLTTLTGLGGRVLGNMLVSALGSLVEPSSMDNMLMVPLYVVWALTMGIFYTCYHRFLTV